MIGNLGAQIGLLSFALAIVAGLQAGNSATTVLLRALFAMIGAAAVGQVAGFVVKLVLRDHLQRRKLSIDRIHTEAVTAMNAAAAEASE